MKKMFAVWAAFVLTLVISGPAAAFAEAVPETETVSAVQEESTDKEGFPEEAAAENLTEPVEVISEIPDTEEEPAEEIEEAEETEAEEELEQGAEPSVRYRTHVQSFGWQDPVSDGAMSGTQGKAKRLEGIEINVLGADDLGVRYMTHIQTYGWESDWKYDGVMSGTQGESKRLEAIRIELTGADAQYFDIWYCVHAQHFGWLDWTKNGAEAGTAGFAYRLEGIKIVLLPKGLAAPGSTARPSVTAAEVPAVVPASAPSYTPSVTPVTTTYVGNKNSGKFHYADCTSVSRMREHNKVFLSSREEAISLGYQPCQICHP